jgi:hypothetical protein
MNPAGHAVAKHSGKSPATEGPQSTADLWKRAEGRFGWQHFIGFFAWPTILIVLGFGRQISEKGLRGMFQDPSGVWYAALGLVILGVAMWWHMHERLRATLELVRHQNLSRS